MASAFIEPIIMCAMLKSRLPVSYDRASMAACPTRSPAITRGDGMSNLYQCFVCGEMFEFAEHDYHGRVVHEWLGKMICNHCETSNWDGIVPEEKLIKRFREAGINEEYNAKGFIVIPP
jgi:hypothetical protein